MKHTRDLMGMPIIVEVVDRDVTGTQINEIFIYFEYIDNKFSVFKQASEISRINQGRLKESESSDDMKTILRLSEQTRRETRGFFDITDSRGGYNPSGLVKGWAIYNAAKILWRKKLNNFYINAGGDIQTSGKNGQGQNWAVGIKNPFNQKEIVKTLKLSGQGIATSGTYIRGQHIYNPLKKDKPITEILSLTVIGPNVYEADRFATAAFAMEREGIMFIENLAGFEGYMIDKNGLATMTSDFEKYLIR